MFPAFPHIYLFLCTIFIFTLSPKWSLPQNLNDNSECFLNRTNTRGVSFVEVGVVFSFFLYSIGVHQFSIAHNILFFHLKDSIKYEQKKYKETNCVKQKVFDYHFHVHRVYSLCDFLLLFFLLDWSNKHLRICYTIEMRSKHLKKKKIFFPVRWQKMKLAKGVLVRKQKKMCDIAVNTQTE